jgi:hypothetical protein
MTALTPSDLEAALRQALPPELHSRAGALARALAAATTHPDAPPPLTDPHLRSLLVALAGMEVQVGSALINFGGAQLGDISFHGAVAGRDVINVSLSIASPQPALAPPERRNRRAMLQKVRAIWIDGLLARSFENLAPIALGLLEDKSAVEIPLGIQYQELGYPPRDLPPGTTTHSVLEQAPGGLLILGAPGSGKTTLLLELCRVLLAQADQEEDRPIPVVFNLSSWAERRSPIARWLEDELTTKYDVPRTIAQVWVTQGQIQPLLDGLDEVAEPHREVCLAAIKTYRREHLVTLVVCSRSADYATLHERLRLDTAILVQPLSDRQIAAYLQSAGPQLARLRMQLAQRPELLELLRTPLMLSVATIAATAEASNITAPSAAMADDLWRRYLLVSQRRRQSGGSIPITMQLRWIGSLARHMVRRSQSQFRIEDLQPDWLDDPLGTLWLHGITGAVRAGVLGLLLSVVGLATSPVAALLLVVIAAIIAISQPGLRWGTQRLFPRFRLRGVYLPSVLLLLLAVALLMTEQSLRSLVNVFLILVSSALVGAAIALVQLALTLATRPVLPQLLLRGRHLPTVLAQLMVAVVAFTVLPPGSFWGIFGIVPWLWGMLAPPSRSIRFADTLTWSWSRALRGGLFALAMMALATSLSILALALPAMLTGGGMSVMVEVVRGNDKIGGFGMLFLGIVLTMTLFGFLFEGFRGVSVDPNIVSEAALRRTLSQAIISGILIAYVGLVVAIPLLLYPFGGMSMENLGLLNNLITPFIVAIPLGLLLGITRGGDDVIRHFSVRLALRARGALPLALTPFLNACADRTLLQRVGAGYIFLHRLLMEYLAGLSNDELTRLGMEIGGNKQFK